MNNESLKSLTRIGAVISAPLGACSYYRSIGPYSKIKNVEDTYKGIIKDWELKCNDY